MKFWKGEHPGKERVSSFRENTALDKSAEEWAEKVLVETRKKIVSRIKREADIKAKGFDSSEEGKKLSEFYSYLIKNMKEIS